MICIKHCTGTKNVIDACIRCKVKRLIYTSSPSVVFDGVHGIFNADESMPYPDKVCSIWISFVFLFDTGLRLFHLSWHDVFLLQFNDSYSETKADGEKLVMRANGREGLLTCCIRPSSIFGPGDKLLVPSLVAAARAGKSKVRIVSYLLICRLQYAKFSKCWWLHVHIDNSHWQIKNTICFK